nr:deoxyribonuclease I [Bdellovibrio sp. HM001]
MIKILIFTVLSAFAKGPADFDDAKRILSKNLDLFENKTVYCGCVVKGKKVDLASCGYKPQKNSSRSTKMEFEHVVPAEAFGQSFAEWRNGSPKCFKKGKKMSNRKCAGTNPLFAKMEGDVYNLFPEIGELNMLRSNYSMAQLSGASGKFGKCAVKLEDKKFEPSDSAKGVVARTYMHMEARYPGRGIISSKNEKLFQAWDKMFPLTKQECKRWEKLKAITGQAHALSSRCKGSLASR